jgi:DNA-binding transcriptional LysR family regulator
MARHPEVTIEMQVTAEVVDLVATGYDLAIRLCPTSGPDVIVRRLGETRVVIAAAPTLFDKRNLPSVPEELTDLPWLANSTLVQPCLWTFRRGDDVRRVKFQPALVASSMDVLHRLVLAGSGVALLSEYAIVDDLKAGRLVRLLPDWLVINVPVLAVYPDNRRISAKVRAFVDFLAHRLDPATLLEAPAKGGVSAPLASKHVGRAKAPTRPRRAKAATR